MSDKILELAKSKYDTIPNKENFVSPNNLYINLEMFFMNRFIFYKVLSISHVLSIYYLLFCKSIIAMLSKR